MSKPLDLNGLAKQYLDLWQQQLGGVAEDELAALTDAGALAVRLGPTVLRTSTAAAVGLGALGVLTSRWGC